jgi:hypothetical protein
MALFISSNASKLGINPPIVLKTGFLNQLHQKLMLIKQQPGVFNGGDSANLFHQIL